MAIPLTRRVGQWASPLLNPGTACKRLCIVGDSHTSYLNNGATAQRLIYGVSRQLPVRIHGIYAPAGNHTWTTTITGSASTLAIGASQHPTDGCLAPQEVIQVAYGSAVASNTLIFRSDFIAAQFDGFVNGNLMKNVAMTVRIGWWASSGGDDLQTVRMRAGFTDDSYTTDTSNIDLRGTEYEHLDMSISATNKDIRWDSLTGAEDETGREWNFIGHRFERTSPGGGISIASIGNGGRTAADYAHATTVCTDARWIDWLTMFGPFDRFMLVLGTNMSASEEASITGVWRNNMLAVAQRLLTMNTAAGGPADAMVLIVTGHDANITGRYADMATAINSCSMADSRIAHADTWGSIMGQGIDYAEMNASYLADGVHFNAAGADLLGQTLADLIDNAASTDSGSGGTSDPRSSRVSRVLRVSRP